MNIHLLTVATNPKNEKLKLWEKTAKKNNWNYTILGLGEKWQGWVWRSKLLSDFCTKNKNTIIFICDSYDVLILGTPRETLDKFKNNSVDLILGVESICGNNCVAPIEPGYTINGGGIIGKSNLLAQAYNYIAENHIDDQIGWYHFLKNNDINYLLDKKQDFVLNYQYGHLNDLGKNTNYPITFFLKSLQGILLTSITRNYLKIDKDNRPITKNNTKPIIIHIPGTKLDNFVLYWDIVSRLKIQTHPGLSLDSISTIAKILYIFLIVILLYLIFYN